MRNLGFFPPSVIFEVLKNFQLHQRNPSSLRNQLIQALISLHYNRLAHQEDHLELVNQILTQCRTFQLSLFFVFVDLFGSFHCNLCSNSILQFIMKNDFGADFEHYFKHLLKCYNKEAYFQDSHLVFCFSQLEEQQKRVAVQLIERNFMKNQRRTQDQKEVFLKSKQSNSLKIDTDEINKMFTFGGEKGNYE